MLIRNAGWRPVGELGRGHGLSGHLHTGSCNAYSVQRDADNGSLPLQRGERWRSKVDIIMAPRPPVRNVRLALFWLYRLIQINAIRESYGFLTRKIHPNFIGHCSTILNILRFLCFLLFYVSYVLMYLMGSLSLTHYSALDSPSSPRQLSPSDRGVVGADFASADSAEIELRQDVRNRKTALRTAPKDLADP